MKCMFTFIYLFVHKTGIETYSSGEGESKMYILLSKTTTKNSNRENKIKKWKQ